VSTLVKHWWGWVRHMSRPIAGVLTPYMDRYTLRRQRDSGSNPWRLYLHNILAADSCGHHNHPSTWSFSIVLWGSYTEEVLDPLCMSGHHGCRAPRVDTRRVRWWNWIPASKYHRITELHPGPGAKGVWTLFVCGPLTGKGWGFFLPGRGHVPHTTMEHTRVTEQK
jgi:hypothetical protein